MSTLLRRVAVDGAVLDVRLRGGSVSDMGELTGQPGEDVIEAASAALIPGLHDHHLHLLALAARATSLDVSAGLAGLASLPGDGWLRGVNWDGDDDRHHLDRYVPNRPVRVQHRSGALWVVNTAGTVVLGLDDVALPGVERDEHGRATGRLWRLDSWLADRLGRETPDLAAVGAQLASLGITGVTDATPDLDAATCSLLRREVPQRLQLLGDPDGTGPVKIVLSDHDLPGLDALCAALRAARPRPVAIHCVTRAALVLMLAAFDEVGRLRGDRVEHAAIVPAELLRRLPSCVVTQPGFLYARGDDYLRDVDPEDLPDLYRLRSLVEAGISAVASSDAPYGPVDPWAVIRSARDRRSSGGAVLGPEESLTAAATLDGYWRPLADLTAPARRITVGAPADVVLLSSGLAEALGDPSADRVRGTWIAGRLTSWRS